MQAGSTFAKKLRTVSAFSSLAFALGLAACSEPTASDRDKQAPQVAVSSPANAFSTADSAVVVDAVVTDSGRVAKVTYSLNDGAPQQVSLTAAPSVALHFEVKPLRVGSNTIVLRVEDAKGNAAEMRLEVTRRAGPAVRVISPAEGDTAWGHAIALRAVVSGITYHDAVQVRVNGTPQPVQNPLLFSDSVAAGEAVDLKPGANTLVVQVTDAEGHTAEQTIHVVAVVPSVNYAVTVLSAAGAVSSLAADINNAGTVVGRWFGAHGESHAIVWQGAAGTTLGSLVSAAAINQKGQIVAVGTDGTYVWENGAAASLPVGARRDAIDINEAGEVLFAGAAVWRRDGHLGPVTTLGVPEGPLMVVALDSAGNVVGNNHWPNSNPVVWTAAGTTRQVPTSGRTTAPTGMNASGDVIGWADPQGGTKHGFLSTGAVYFNLNSIVGLFSVASALSANGTVSGTYKLEGQSRLYRFRNGKTTDVVLAEAGWTIDSVVAVNDSGQIAVNAHQGSGPITALLLTPIP
ncbi:MAG TPA: hypothetical protein VFE05_00795 [Longimicrobiaceae bacterium]|jgi:hypothetical protein|nr:hypothetical protein [Longimicrobiaceae bacterium]